MIRAKTFAVKFYRQLDLFKDYTPNNEERPQSAFANHLQLTLSISPLRARLLSELVIGGHDNDQ